MSGSTPTSSGADVVMTNNGDTVYYNSGRQRLAKGTDDQVLTLASGIPSWANGGKLKLLHSEILSSDTSTWTIEPATAWDYEDYSKFIIIMEFDSDGTGGMTNLTWRINSRASGYGYTVTVRSATSETLTSADTQSTGLLTSQFVQTENAYIEAEILVNDFPTGERYTLYKSYGRRYGDPKLYTYVNGYANIATTEINKIEIFEDGDGDILTGSILTIYGVEK